MNLFSLSPLSPPSRRWRAWTGRTCPALLGTPAAMQSPVSETIWPYSARSENCRFLIQPVSSSWQEIGRLLFLLNKNRTDLVCHKLQFLSQNSFWGHISGSVLLELSYLGKTRLVWISVWVIDKERHTRSVFSWHLHYHYKASIIKY